ACGRTTVTPTPTPAPTSAPATTTARPAPVRAAEPPPQQSSSKGLPDRLSDADFFKLASDISEPGGYFRIEDNYTSNEMEIGQLFTMLQTQHVSGGVYMGVGPEQNF